MHDSAMANGKRFFETYVSRMTSPLIVDIGAQDVNGSLKQCSPSSSRYVGVDFVAGNGVDVILDDPYKLPFESNSIDVVVSSSCFEHSEMFWVIYLEILRVMKPEGIFFLTAPSNGPVHRFPVDCWRFYPDSGLALIKWAELNNFEPAVLESYISNQMLESWNDYVCVFIKDKKLVNKHPSRILDTFSDFTNGHRFGSSEYLNQEIRPEDQRSRGWKISKRISQEFQKKGLQKFA